MNSGTLYTITDTRSNAKVNVCFEPLTENDAAVLKGEDWQTARFREVWKAFAEHAVAQKLTWCDGEEKPLLGLVHIGTVRKRDTEVRALCDSLLEAAPVYCFGAEGRRYRGIGRVLVARLVIASKELGAEGRLLVRPAPLSLPFYQTLGFREARIPDYFRLGRREAGVLLQECTSELME